MAEALHVTRPNVRAGRVLRAGLHRIHIAQNSMVNVANGGLHETLELPASQQGTISVLVAVESARVREALVAMLGALERFRLVAEADNDEAAIEAARRLKPDLVLIEPELSDCGGWWAIRQIQAEHLAGTVVGLGRRADCGGLAELVGAQRYIQMGTSPRDLLSALEAAMDYAAGAGQAVTGA